MKTIITHLIIAFAIVTSMSISAQEREAPQLDLGDLGWSGTAFDSVTAFSARPFLWGWNWLSTDSGETYKKWACCQHAMTLVLFSFCLVVLLFIIIHICFAVQHIQGEDKQFYHISGGWQMRVIRIVAAAGDKPKLWRVYGRDEILSVHRKRVPQAGFAGRQIHTPAASLQELSESSYFYLHYSRTPL